MYGTGTFFNKKNCEKILTLARYSDVTTPSLNENTVSSLQKTIKDLTIQRQELDIIIKVLTNHLNHLLSQSNKFKGHKRIKHDG